MVALEPIDEHNVRAVFDLEVADHQRGHVAPNPWSLAQALAYGDRAVARGVVADGEIVGFLLLGIDPDPADGRGFWLWRLMIGADHQGRGLGAAAVAAAIEEVRRRGATELYVSWVPGDDGPADFYRRLGFTPTGDLNDGEVVAALAL